MSHTCRSLIIHCMDFRFIRQLTDYFAKAGHLGNADFVGWAGAGKAFLDPAGRDFVMHQVELSKQLHNIDEVHVVNHLDCGAYGGSKAFPDQTVERAKHLADLKAVRQTIQQRFPHLEVFGYLASLSGDAVTVEKLTL